VSAASVTGAAAGAPAGSGAALPASLKKNQRLSRWLRIDADGTVWISPGKVELGQGILTALAQIAAEELDVALERVRLFPAQTSRSPDEGVTSGSLSIQDSGAALRLVCAEARALLIGHAAAQLGVSAAELTVSDGEIVHSSGAAASYWLLAGAGLLEREASASVAPKPPEHCRIVGTSAPRRDIPGKILAQPGFVQDLDFPGMLYGRVVRTSRPGARLAACDEREAAAMPGVAAIVRDGSFLGVAAEREEQAIAAAAALARASIWEGGADLPDPSALREFLERHAAAGAVLSEKSDPCSASPAQTLAASYSKPFLSHASIGPSCAVARLDGGSLTVWTHSQGIYNLRRDLALALALPETAIEVHHREGAGCYGHNGADDVALDAALLARALPGRAVKLQWMREDEFGCAPCGSAMRIDLRASLDDRGCIVDWRHDLWSAGHSMRPGRAPTPALLAAWQLAQPHAQPRAINMALPAGGAERNAIPIYDFPGQRIVNHYVEAMPVRTSALRSLGGYANVYAIESFMDELALLAGADPVEFRLRHLADARGRAVIEAAARRSGWRAHGSAPGRPSGRGIGFAKYKNLGAYCAVVAEVEVERAVRVRRLTVAIDVGRVINPDGVANQTEGGAIQAASWTLKEELRFDREGIRSLSWEDYPILAFSEVPAVDVEIIDRPGERSVGAGEAAMGPTAAAIANALHAALGVRVRDLPLTPEHVAAAMR
jgi:CO/xanthine dehydrogenase Mo-binding subunit